MEPKTPAASETVLEHQRRANEELLLAGLRAMEQADAAREAARVLEETAELREILIGVIGHDLRSPLSSILMAAETQLMRGSLHPVDANLASSITAAARRMARMIDQLTDFTRSRRGGGFELALRPTDFSVVAAGIAKELRLASSTEIIDAYDGDLHGVWDADRIAVVVQNLAGNAVEHATAGTPVLVAVFDEVDHVVCEISNQGLPIPEDLLPVIFKPFRGASGGTTRAAGHLGLGLYIAYEIVKAHGGSLTVASADGVTRFTMRIPRVSSAG